MYTTGVRIWVRRYVIDVMRADVITYVIKCYVIRRASGAGVFMIDSIGMPNRGAVWCSRYSVIRYSVIR